MVFFALRFVAWCIQWSVATVFFLAVMAGAGYYVYTEALSGGQYVTVPDVVDLPIIEASYLLTEKGLELGEQSQAAHPTVPKYHVITQRPQPGRVVRTGRKVYATVSMGREFLEAPDLLRSSLDEAHRTLTQSRFRIGTVARIPHETPRDTVIAQDPPPAARIANQGDVHLLVSAGTKESGAFMPDIRGMPVEQALAKLSEYNVTMVPKEVDISGARVDVVLNQDPPPDTLIQEGQVVRYEVKPSGAVELPDTRYEAVVRYQVNYDWYDRDVRVDIVDRRGNRQTVWSKPPLYDDQARSTYVAGSAIRLPVTYVGEASVEIYINDVLVESFYLEDGAEPRATRKPQ